MTKKRTNNLFILKMMTYVFTTPISFVDIAASLDLDSRYSNPRLR